MIIHSEEILLFSFMLEKTFSSSSDHPVRTFQSAQKTPFSVVVSIHYSHAVKIQFRSELNYLSCFNSRVDPSDIEKDSKLLWITQQSDLILIMSKNKMFFV